VHLAGRADETHEQLKREPADTYSLHQEEGVLEDTGWGKHVHGDVLVVGVVLVEVLLDKGRGEDREAGRKRGKWERKKCKLNF
jgi:hypothetical protein